MNELIALRSTQNGEPVSYAVKHKGSVIQNAVRLSVGAVRAFFDQTRKNNPSVPDAAISVMLSQYVAGWVQGYDFATLPPVHIDAADMLVRHGVPVVATWDRQLEIETQYSSEGTPIAAVQYATRIKAGGEERNIRLRVPYTAYIYLKERVSKPWDSLRDAVTTAFEARLRRPNYLTRDGEIIEFSAEEVLSER
jgi:hypothetical protein